MKKHFIYGILLFLLFERVSDIFIVLIKIINEKQDLSNTVIYIMLAFSAILSVIFFFFFLNKLNFNRKSLVLLIVFYILSFIILYLLNKQIGVIMADNLELNKKNNFMDIQVFAWSEIFVFLAKIIVLTLLSITTLKQLNNNNGSN